MRAVQFPVPIGPATEASKWAGLPFLQFKMSAYFNACSPTVKIS
jgi:hypothetical protein